MWQLDHARKRPLPCCCYRNYGRKHENGAVIVDVSIDTGGCLKPEVTPLTKTNVYKSNVLHY
jgi:alanine dehydrogenase